MHHHQKQINKTRFGNIFYEPTDPNTGFKYPHNKRRVPSEYYDGKLNYATDVYRLPIDSSKESLRITFDGERSPCAAYLRIQYSRGAPVLFGILPPELNRLISEYAVARPDREDTYRTVMFNVRIRYPDGFPFEHPRYYLAEPLNHFPSLLMDKFKCFLKALPLDFSPVMRSPEQHILSLIVYLDIVDSMQRMYDARKRKKSSSAVVIFIDSRKKK
jgi:ubiquitin-protein ligase